MHADLRMETAELAAMRDLYAAVPPDSAAALGVVAHDLAGALCAAVTALASARTFNRVAGLGVTGTPGDPELDAIADFYVTAGSPHVISIAPATTPPDLGDRLLARGYEADYPWVKFARPVTGASGPSATDLRIVRIGAERAEDFGRVVADGFDLPEPLRPWIAALAGRPGWSCHLALDGDDAVGAGAVFLHEGAGWLGLGATLPEYRGRGAQNAVLHDRIAAAAEAGCDLVVTETGAAVEGMPSNSYRNILRQGFEAVYERPNLRNPDPGGS